MSIDVFPVTLKKIPCSDSRELTPVSRAFARVVDLPIRQKSTQNSQNSLILAVMREIPCRDTSATDWYPHQPVHLPPFARRRLAAVASCSQPAWRGRMVDTMAETARALIGPLRVSASVAHPRPFDGAMVGHPCRCGSPGHRFGWLRRRQRRGGPRSQARPARRWR